MNKDLEEFRYPFENKILEYIDYAITKKKVLPTLVGEVKNRFDNEVDCIGKIFGISSKDYLEKGKLERAALYFAVWGAYNLKGLGDVEETEMDKMDKN